jgi:hypothetical protein
VQYIYYDGFKNVADIKTNSYEISLRARQTKLFHVIWQISRYTSYRGADESHKIVHFFLHAVHSRRFVLSSSSLFQSQYEKKTATEFISSLGQVFISPCPPSENIMTCFLGNATKTFGSSFDTSFYLAFHLTELQLFTLHIYNT